MTAVPKDKPSANKPPRLVDEFDAYTQVFRDAARWRWIALGLGVVALLLLFLLVVKSFQPPVVIVKDQTSSERPDVIVGGPTPALTPTDAENFFLYALRRRYGWESLTLLRDFNEIYELMTREMGTAFSAYVNEKVKPQGSTQEKPRVLTWVESGVRNSVALDRKNIECRKGEAVKGVDQWFCRGFGYIETQPMEGPVPEAAQIRKRVEFRARLQPAPYDNRRVFGFVLAYLDALDAEEAK